MTKLKVLQWNLENLFVFLDTPNDKEISQITEIEWQRLTLARMPNKALNKLNEIKETIERVNPDICVFCEVGGKESLHNLNKLFLDNQYTVHMAKSNSSRGIDIGFLVKKDVDYQIKVKSNRFFKLDSKFQEDSKFSRDIPELRFYDGKELKLVIMGVHFKSKLSMGDDYFGIETRASEIRGLIKIYQRLRIKYNVPIMVAGDFNGQMRIDSEFEPLLVDTDLRDYLDYTDYSDEDRATFVLVTDKVKAMQLDYIMVSPDLIPVIDFEESKVLRFKTFYDIDLPLPTSFTEKKKLPSDHYPQVISLKII